jgi:hypothetical protein
VSQKKRGRMGRSLGADRMRRRRRHHLMRRTATYLSRWRSMDWYRRRRTRNRPLRRHILRRRRDLRLRKPLLRRWLLLPDRPHKRSRNRFISSRLRGLHGSRRTGSRTLQNIFHVWLRTIHPMMRRHLRTCWRLLLQRPLRSNFRPHVLDWLHLGFLNRRRLARGRMK